MTASLILDGVIAGLLMVTIGYCVTLNRRLRAVRQNGDELRRVVASLNEATAKAEAAFSRLKQAGEGIDDALKERIGEARAVYDDLAFVMKRASGLVGRLSEPVAAAQSAPRPRRASGLAPGVEQGESQTPPELSRAERELLEALAR
ncbi:MAG: DUF6468 domain-containing protein [Alphaproteobacteria bacterium]